MGVAIDFAVMIKENL